MTTADPYTVTFTPAARRRLSRLPLPAATALHEHLTGPVASNPHRLGKPLDAPFEDVRLIVVTDNERIRRLPSTMNHRPDRGHTQSGQRRSSQVQPSRSAMRC